MIGNFKTEKEHVDIRAYKLVDRLLREFRHGDATAASTALRRLKGPADRAAKKALKPPKSPARKDWDTDHNYALEWLSKFIRTRGTQPFSGGLRYGRCVTCGALHEFKELQCGHWQSRAYWGTKFHDKNNSIQCRGCNAKHLGNGKQPEHEAHIRKAYPVPAGQMEWPERLKILVKTKPKELTGPELRAVGDDYKRRTEQWLAREGVG